jgi:hypothetical protein
MWPDNLYLYITKNHRLRLLYKGEAEVEIKIESLQTLTTVFCLVGRLCSSDKLQVLLVLYFSRNPKSTIRRY